MPNQDTELEQAERDLDMSGEVEEVGAGKKRRGKVVSPGNKIGDLTGAVVGATAKSVDLGEATGTGSLTMTAEFAFAAQRLYVKVAPLSLAAAAGSYHAPSRVSITSIKFQGKEQIVGSGFLPAEMLEYGKPDPGIDWPSVDGKGDIVIAFYNEDPTVHLTVSACAVGLITE